MDSCLDALRVVCFALSIKSKGIKDLPKVHALGYESRGTLKQQ